LPLNACGRLFDRKLNKVRHGWGTPRGAVDQAIGEDEGEDGGATFAASEETVAEMRTSNMARCARAQTG